MKADPEQLARTAEANIASIEFLSEFSDDHIPCACVNIKLVDGTVVKKVNLWHIGSEGVAALMYADHPKATTYIRDNILQQIMDDALCAIFEGYPDDNTAKILSIVGAKVRVTANLTTQLTFL